MPNNKVIHDIINSEGRQNECDIYGVLKNGKNGSIIDWLTDERVENMCGQPYEVFSQVTRITVRRRIQTDIEIASQSQMRPSVNVNRRSF